MEQTTLKYLRVLIPGLAFYLGAFPFVKYYFGDTYHIESLGLRLCHRVFSSCRRDLLSSQFAPRY
jgi:hypothetical protein